MTDSRRVFLVVVLHYLVGLAGCLAYSFIHPISVYLIEPFVVGYRIKTAILLFVTFMPALQISGMLVGYAIVFKSHANEEIPRWSAMLLEYLMGAFVLCLVCITLYFAMAEGVSPFLKVQQASAVSRTGDYRDLVDIARNALAEDRALDAEFQLRGALTIWPGSPEANQLMERSKYRLAELEGFKPDQKKKREKIGKGPRFGLAPDAMTRSEKGITVLEALDRSAEAERKHDYFNAHYFAILAWRLAADTDPNKALALQRAAEAWGRISEGADAFHDAGDIARYKVKREGYESIQNGDYLKAYYILLAEYETEKASRNGTIDPDVERFLEVSKKGVLETFFFIDETENVRLFESSRDVFFINRRADGKTDSVFIRGMTYMQSGGQEIAYLRDLEIARFDADSKLVYRVAVPYAKMFPFTQDGKNPRPELILHAVDRNRQGADILPEVLEGKVPDEERNILVLDMPYRDFSLILAANRGPSAMSLAEMFGISGTAAKYGFSREVYQRELITRLAEPFLILILSVYALILGWRYRLGKNTLFKAWWALAIPLLPIICLYVIETVRYLSRLSIVAFVGLVPENGVILTLAFLSLCFLLVSIAFFAQRSD